jgi:hypothetical protein
MHLYRLNRHLSFCEIEGTPLFLDIAGDRYFALEGELAAAFERLRAGQASPDDIAALKAADMIEPTPHQRPIAPAPPHVPRASLVEQRERVGKAGAGLPFLIAADLLRVRLVLRRGGLAHLIASVREQKSRAAAGRRPEAALEELAGAYSVARSLVPLARNCLSDSLTFIRLLALRGHHPDLVLGVKRNPFAAHCWVQTDTLVLNDSADSARDFTPVLVV